MKAAIAQGPVFGPALAIFFAIVASLGAVGIGAAVDTPSTLMSPADHAALRKAVAAETRLALAACRELHGVERDICKAEARAQERIARADLQARYHGTVSTAHDARRARVKALYDVARARCGSHSGEERLQCLRAAREQRNRTLEAPLPAAT